MQKNKFSNRILKYATCIEAQERYKLSRNMLMRVATQAGAVRRIGRSVRIDVCVLDEFLDNMNDYCNNCLERE